MSFGQRIAAARRARGWTQSELAGRVGTHASTVSAFESERKAGEDLLARFLVALLSVGPIHDIDSLLVDWARHRISRRAGSRSHRLLFTPEQPAEELSK